jgi:hypothetical protein
MFFKEQLRTLVEDGDYDRDDPLHRCVHVVRDARIM